MIGRKKVGEIRELMVGDFPGCPVDHHHAGGSAIPKGARGNEPGWKFVMEIGSAHDGGRSLGESGRFCKSQKENARNEKRLQET